MPKEKISIFTDFKKSASAIYHAWLDSKSHSAFTGGDAEIEAKVNSSFTAWNGYITGQILELDTDKRILQSWRTVEFDEDDEDSILEVKIEDLEDGHSRLTLTHSNLPAGTGKKYKDGWKENYFDPMHDFFD